MKLFKSVRGSNTTKLLSELENALDNEDFDLIEAICSRPFVINTDEEQEQAANLYIKACYAYHDMPRHGIYIRIDHPERKHSESEINLVKSITGCLLDKGLSPNATTDGVPLIHAVLDMCTCEDAEDLIRAGANANSLNKQGMSPLGAGIAKGKFNPTYKFQTYLSAGATLNSEDLNNWNVYRNICKYGIYGIAKTIPKDKLKEFAKKKVDGFTLLHYAVGGTVSESMINAGKPGHFGLFKGSPNKFYEQNSDYPKIVTMLLDAGADPFARMTNDDDAISIAAFCGHVEILKVLNQRVGNSEWYDGINRPIDGKITPLFRATYSNEVEVVKALLAMGGDPNLPSFVHSSDTKFLVLARDEDESTERYQLFTTWLVHLWGRNEDESTERYRPKPGTAFSLFARDEDESDERYQLAWPMAFTPSSGAYWHEENGIPNLYYPVLENYQEVVRCLLEAGENPNALTCTGLFPLYVAAESGNLDIIKDLLNYGAKINQTTSKGNTALHSAAEEGHVETVVYLLNNGADPSIVNKAGYTPEEAARRCGQLATADKISTFEITDVISIDAALREYYNRARLSEWGSTDLNDLKRALVAETINAFMGVYGSTIKESILADQSLFLYFANMSIANSANDEMFLQTLIEEAQENSSLDDFLLLVIKDYQLAAGILSENEQVVRDALSAGADPNQRCTYKKTLYTPIIAAARSGSEEICELLINAGAEVNQAQDNSETALANAANLGDYGITSLLLENGADPNAMTYAGTALAAADNIAIIYLLLDYGANPNIADSDGDLPIIGFIDQHRYEAVYVLKCAGTDLERKNLRGESALQHAYTQGDPRMVDLLINDNGYHEPMPEVNLGAMRETILERTRNLLSLSYPLNYFPKNSGKKYQKLITEKQYDNLRKSSRLGDQAVNCKRYGDLAKANELYLESVKFDDVLDNDRVWGWFKVLLLAKNFYDAYIILRYYHALSVSNNLLQIDAGELCLDECRFQDIFLTLDFDSYDVFYGSTLTWPLDKEAVESKIQAFGGARNLEMYASTWGSYSLSDEEYDIFIKYFVYSERNNRITHTTPYISVASLERFARLGDVKAMVFLAEVIASDDPGRAKELCDRVIKFADDEPMPFSRSTSNKVRNRAESILLKLENENAHIE